MEKSHFYEKLISVILGILLVLILEGVSRLVPFKNDELEEILSVLEQDPVLFWKLKSNLNTSFQNTQLITNRWGLREKDFKFRKDANAIRIICLGASPTFGWGVEYQEAYPYQLRKNLIEKFHIPYQIEVINAGVIGYSSYQGLLFFKDKILKFNPDIITVSYGINDVDKYRFFRNNGKPDKYLYPKNRLLTSFENILQRSRLFHLMRSIFLRTKKINSKYYGGVKNLYHRYRRVSLGDYENNLKNIIKIAKEKNIKVILLKMPMRSPFKLVQVNDSAKDLAERFITASIYFANTGRYLSAITCLVKSLECNPYSAKAFYYLGVYNYKLKNYNLAKICFQMAKELELQECALAIKMYNNLMEKVAREYRVPIVDVSLIFQNKEEMFLNPDHDFVHPSVLGHKKIGEGIAKVLYKYCLLSFSLKSYE